MQKLGCDVSKYNPRCDFGKAKANGLDFVIIRAGSGAKGGYEDPMWVTHYKDAKKAGLAVGAYWYCYARDTSQAIAEADMFLKSLEGMQFEYPVYLDLEDPSQAGLGKSRLTDIAVTFMDRIEKKGYYTGIYSMGSWFQSKLDMNRLKPYDVWVAHWGRKDRPSYVRHGMWQFTNHFDFPGIAKAGVECDGNYAFVDYPSVIKKAGLNGFGKKDNEQVVKEKQTQKTGDILNVSNKNKEVERIILQFSDGTRKEYK